MLKCFAELEALFFKVRMQPLLEKGFPTFQLASQDELKSAHGATSLEIVPLRLQKSNGHGFQNDIDRNVSCWVCLVSLA